MKYGGLFFAILLVFSNKMGAQDGPVLVVTGSKVEQDAGSTVEAVEVITGEEIAAMGAKTVAEVMENIPGVVIFDHPQATVMMQGFEGAYVKIMIDGMEITGDIGGATPVNMIPVADIERIEIVRGASSVLYGSDAMGGVINIITKKAERDKFSFRLKQEISSNLRYYGETSIGYARKLFALSAGASFDWDDGKVSERKNNLGRRVSVYDVAASRLGSARLSTTWFHPGGELELFGSWNDTLLNVSADLDNGYDFMYTKLEGGLKGSFKFSDFALLDGYFNYRQLDYDADKINNAFNTRSVYAGSFFRDLEGELRFSWEPGISHAVLLGLNLQRDALESDAFYGEKSRVIAGIFLQDTWNILGLDRFRLVPGLRFDYRAPGSSGEDPVYNLSPKLSFRYDPLENLALRFSYGMGFKTPSLKQNYWVFFHPAPYNFLLIGNPGLRPETSQGFNLSLDYGVTKNFNLNLQGYFNYLFDLIDDYISDENPGSARNASGDTQDYIYTRGYRNVGRAITTGGNFSLKYNGPRLKLLAAYDLTVAKGYDEESDTYRDLGSRVPHQVSLRAAYTFPVIETTLQVSGNWNAPQLVNGGGMGDGEEGHTPDYLMAGLRISKFFFKERLEIYGAVQNLLNNIHFIKSSGGKNQEDYYGLRDGIIVSIGAGFKW